MEQHAHLPRFLRGISLPLTRLSQRAGATTADAGRIHYPEASIGFSTLFVRNQRLTSGTVHCSVRLEGKVLPREAASFEGCGNRRLAIAPGRGLLRFGLGHSSRKLGGAHLCRLKLMPQFQAHIPNPLRDDLPGFLPSGRVATPAVGILLVVFRGRAPAQRRHDAGRAPPHRRR